MKNITWDLAVSIMLGILTGLVLVFGFIITRQLTHVILTLQTIMLEVGK